MTGTPALLFASMSGPPGTADGWTVQKGNMFIIFDQGRSGPQIDRETASKYIQMPRSEPFFGYSAKKDVPSTFKKRQPQGDPLQVAKAKITRKSPRPAIFINRLVDVTAPFTWALVLSRLGPDRRSTVGHRRDGGTPSVPKRSAVGPSLLGSWHD